MTFSTAVIALQEGKKVKRSTWENSELSLREPHEALKRVKNILMYFYHVEEKIIYIHHQDTQVTIPYIPDRSDFFADDWIVVEDS